MNMSLIKNSIFILLLCGLCNAQFQTYQHYYSFGNRPIESYTAEANALFARMTTAPTAARKVIINTLIVDLKVAGIWAKSDRMWVLASHADSSSRLNWISDVDNCLKMVTANLTFTVDQGWSTAVASYLNTQFVPSTDGVFYTLNSAAHAIYDRTSTSGGTSFDMGAQDGTNYVGIQPRLATDLIRGFVNVASSSYVQKANTNTQGFYVCNRSANNSHQVSKNGEAYTTEADTSTNLTSMPIWILCYNNNNAVAGQTTRQIAFVWFGGALSVTEAAAFNTAVEKYMDAIGAGVE